MESEDVCTSKAYVIPPGYSDDGSDCDDSNRTIWAWTSLGTDLDKDGYTRTTVDMCIGLDIPSPYITPTKIVDCNDQDQKIWRWMPVYQDQDGDGIGSGQFSQQCMGLKAPAGFSLGGYDPNDKDLNVTEVEIPTFILR